MNISNLLARNARKYPDQIAVISMGKETTYTELNDSVNRLASAFQSKGIHKGDKIIIFMPNVLEFVVAYFAIQRVGAIVVPINAKFTKREIEFVIAHSEAKAIVAHHLIFSEAESIQFNGLRIKTGAAVEEWLSFEELLASRLPTEVECLLKEDDDSTLLYTSGTTGTPKGVLLTNRNVLAVSHMIAIEMEVKPESRLLIMMPLSHSAPLNLFLVTGVLVGSTLVLTPTFTPDLLLDTVEGYRTTHFFGAPVAYLLTSNLPRIKSADLTSMRWWVYGGAPLSKKEVLHIQNQFKTEHLVCVYGLTEAGPSGAILHAEDHPQRAGSIGNRAPFGTELRIVDDNGEDVAQGEIGEIILFGEGNMKEYYKNPEDTKEVFINGWIKSGDLARMDEDGYLYIIDRKKDVIIAGGVNIYPKEIEDCILQYKGIQEVAVVGVPNKEWGETVKVVFAAKEEIDIEKLKDFLNGQLASYKIPRIYVQVDALPRNASGKILKQQLKEVMV